MERSAPGAGWLTLVLIAGCAHPSAEANALPDKESKDVDRSALQSFVRGRSDSIRACYERELQRNPGLKGKLVARFTITPTGAARDVGIEEDTLANPEVASCITSLIAGWTFPFTPDQDVPVAYPFLLSPGG